MMDSSAISEALICWVEVALTIPEYICINKLALYIQIEIYIVIIMLIYIHPLKDHQRREESRFKFVF